MLANKRRQQQYAMHEQKRPVQARRTSERQRAAADRGTDRPSVRHVAVLGYN